MIVAGVVLLIAGWLTGYSILWLFGVILLILGIIFWVIGGVGNRPRYW